jgi:hypothetical protein
VGKVWIALLATSPFLGFFAWAGWWLVTDAFRERKRMSVIVHDLSEERRDVARSVDEVA